MDLKKTLQSQKMLWDLKKTQNPSKNAHEKTKMYANCDPGHYTNRNDQTDQGEQTDQTEQDDLP